MFCASCGKSCVSNAKFCHNCGESTGQFGGEGKVTGKVTATTTGKVTGKVADATAGRMTFAQFRALKEEDRAKHFTKKNGKRLKLEGKASSKAVTCKIQIGILINKDGSLRVKRGCNATLPLTAATSISYDELLTKAAEKHHRFNKDVVKNEEKKFYCLLYADKTSAESLPGSDEPFTLQRYKEEIGKPYSKIVLYLCRWADYYSARFNELEYSSGDESSQTVSIENNKLYYFVLLWKLYI